MQPFLALITPVGAAEQPPLGIWGPTDPRPTPPVAGPGRPPWWGMANDPGWSGGSPSQPPLVIWGPGDPRPTPPVAGPGRPPWWGMAQDPGYGVPLPPLGTWGGSGERFPTNPIAEPPWGWGGTPPVITLPPDTALGKVEWKTAWTAATGWVVIGIPTGPTPTPSKK